MTSSISGDRRVPYLTLNLLLRKLLLLSFVLVVVAFRPVSSSSGQCSLVTIYGLKTADCMNLKLKSLPRYLDGDLKTLNFHDNEMTTLDMDSLHTYPSLQNLYLVRNRLRKIADDSFRGLQNLQILDLEGNQLDSIPSRAFQHVTSLRMLSFKSNPIQFVRNDDLHQLKNIETLNFENCWLKRIEPRAFADLVNLQELNLVNNELQSLDADMEDALSKTLNVIRLHSNPWNCDCRLRWLRKALIHRIKNWDFGPNTPSCDGPDLLRGVNWRHLSSEQFACPSTIVGNSTTSIELKVGSNVSIECIVFGDPEPAITWMKGSKFVSRESISDGLVTSGITSKEKHIRSVITLRDVNQADASDYKCIAVNSAGRSEVTYKVWVVESGTTTSIASAALSFGLEVILGVAIAGIGLVIIFLFCIWCLLARQRNRRRESLKLQDKNLRKENAFTAQGGIDEKSVDASDDGQKENRPKKETLLVLTSVVDGSLTGKGSPVIRQTVLPPENDNDDEWSEESEQQASDEDTSKSENLLRSPDRDKEPMGFKMKIFAVPSPGAGELCDDKSSTASIRSRENSANVLATTEPEGNVVTSGIRFKESPPDLLCDRHVMINSTKDKRPEKTEHLQQSRQSGHAEKEQKQEGETETNAGALTINSERLSQSGRSLKSNAIPTERKPISGPVEPVKSPVKMTALPHCDNPICLKERISSFNLERFSTGSPPVTKELQLCGRKVTHPTVGSTAPPLPPVTRTRRTTADLDWSPRMETRDNQMIRSSVQKTPLRRPDAYATLPVKPNHGRRVEFNDLCTTITKDLHQQPSSSQLRTRNTPRSAMARTSLSSDYTTLSPSCKTSAIFSRSVEQPHHTGYPIDYSTSGVRTMSSADWLDTNPQRARGSQQYGHNYSSKLSGSSSTLDIRDARELQTTPSMPRKVKGCSATSLLDILSPPFATQATHGGSRKDPTTQQQSKKPKPGEQDEFGTAV